jgi:hypothetical protein
MQQGDVSSVVMYLVSGSVSVVSDGEKRVSIQAPAMIGHHSFIYRRPRTAAIICESHVVYFQVALDELVAAANAAEAVHAPSVSLPLHTNFAAVENVGTHTSTSKDPVDLSHVPSVALLQVPTTQDYSASLSLLTGSSGHAAPSSTHAAAAPIARTIASAGEQSFVSHQMPSESAGRLSSRGIVPHVHSSNHHPDNLPSHAPSSSVSSVGRELAGMSVSDSLGMMMRQHHVCSNWIVATRSMTHVSRKQTLLPSWCLKH